MPSSKKLSQLVPDLRSGLQFALELTAHDTTMELKRRGPYWTGEFEAAWEVQLGQVPIPEDQKGGPWEGDNKKERKVTPAFVPPDDTNSLKGYTIGNLMEYTPQATDLAPGTDGVIRGDRERATAPGGKDWFTTYLQNGQAHRIIGNATKKGMGLAGFDR